MNQFRKIARLFSIGFLMSLLLFVNIQPLYASSPSITTEPSGIISTGPGYTGNTAGYRVYWGSNIAQEYIKVDGVIAFCIEPQLLISKAGGYTVSDFSHEQKELFSRIIYHGYDKQPSAENYHLTQLVLWETIASLQPDLFYEGYDQYGVSNYEVKKQALLNEVKAHEVLPSFYNTTIHLKLDEQSVITDENKVMSDIAIIDRGGLEVAINGQSLAIKSISNTMMNTQITLKKFGDIEASASVSPLLYAHPTNQNVIVKGNPSPMVFNLNIEIEPQGIIEIFKHHDNKPIENAVFELLDENQKVVDRLTTGQLGKVQSKRLPLGTYTLIEVEAPQGFVLDDTLHVIELVQDQKPVPLVNKQIRLENKVIQGYIEIVKLDELTNEPIKDVHFKIIDRKTNTEVDTLISDENGRAISKLLDYGDYIIKEVDAPLGYHILDNHFEVSINQDKQVKELVITNEPVRLSIHIIKQNSVNKEPLAGVEYEIRQNDKIIEKLVTDINGEAISNHSLTYGDYQLHETKAVDGFIKNEPVDFSVNRQSEFIEIGQVGKVMQFTFENTPTSTLINKTDHNGTPLAGAKLKLVDENQKVMDQWISTNQPHRISGLIVDKTYTLIEEKAPEGYLTSLPYQFIVLDTLEDQHIKLVNDHLVIIETLAHFGDNAKTSYPLSSTTLTDDIVLNNLIVNRQYQIVGKVLVENQVIAQKVVDFVANQTNQTLTMDFNLDLHQFNNQKLVVTQELYHEGRLIMSHNDLNDPQQTVYVQRPQYATEASFMKRDVSSPSTLIIKDVIRYENVLENQPLTIHSWIMNKETQQPLIINNHAVKATLDFIPLETQGEVIMEYQLDGKNLVAGEYVIFSQILNEDEVIAKHEDYDDLLQQVNFYELIVTKKDAINQEYKLANAKFVIIQDGLSVHTGISDIEGEYRVVLEQGDYQVLEVMSPSGYELSDESLEIALDQNTRIDFLNQPIIELPDTGMMQSVIYLGIALILLGIGSYGIHKYRNMMRD